MKYLGIYLDAVQICQVYNMRIKTTQQPHFVLEGALDMQLAL